MRTRLIAILITVMGLALLGGCGKSQSARFYALSPMKEPPAAPETKTGRSGIVIGIGPIRMADYLNQQDLVTRDSGNRLVMAEFDQWAGSFEDNFTNALAENIGFLVGAEQIYDRPWRQSMPIDYQIALNVIRFDGRLGEEGQLIVRWSVLGGDPKTLLGAKRSSIQEPTGGASYEDLVAAQSRALVTLSHEIAEVIRTAEQNLDR